jgi:hypothetical protein
MSLDDRGRPSGGASVRAWSTTSRLPRIAGHGRMVGAKRRLAIASARSYCPPAPSRHDRRSGWTLLSRRPDTHSDTRPDSRPRWTPCLACWTARADTNASGHAVGRGGDRPIGCPPGRRSGGCPGSVQPSRGASIPTASVAGRSATKPSVPARPTLPHTDSRCGPALRIGRATRAHQRSGPRRSVTLRDPSPGAVRATTRTLRCGLVAGQVVAG